MAGSEFTNRLPITGRECHELLDRIDGKGWIGKPRKDRNADRRTSPRLEYRHADIPVRIEHLGGSASHLLVNSRNLSTGGLSFLHGGFIHPGSRCDCALLAVDGPAVRLSGTIVASRHIEGMIHEIGLQFDVPIDIARFIPGPERPRDKRATISVPQLRCRIICVEPSSADAGLLFHYLSPTGARVNVVDNPGAAIDEVKRKKADKIITELDIDGEDGIEAIQTIRSLGFDGPIIAMTAKPDATKLAAAKDAGADHVLIKPIDGKALYEHLRSSDQRATGKQGQDDVSMQKQMQATVNQPAELAGQLEAALNDSDTESLRKLCAQITNATQQPAVEALAEAAALSLQSLNTADSVDDCRQQVERLIELCRQARKD